MSPRAAPGRWHPQARRDEAADGGQLVALEHHIRPESGLIAGTHVASTRQVGCIEVVKIENKGKGFRRIRIRVGG